MLRNRWASRADKERWPRAALVQETRMVSGPIHPRRRLQHQPLTCGEYIIGHIPFVSLVTLLPCWALVSRQAQLTRVSLFPWSSCGSRWPWGKKKKRDLWACCAGNPGILLCNTVLCGFKVKQLQKPNTQHFIIILGQQWGINSWKNIILGSSVEFF